MSDVELRELVPQVLSVLVRRGADFATAEDAVQEALIRALSTWKDDPPADPTGWLITVAWRAFLDSARSEASRRDREVRFDAEPPSGAVPSADDTLHLYFLCAHPELTSASAVALTPIVRLNRAVAVGEADGALAGLAALAAVDEQTPRRDAVAAHLHEKNGDLVLAARLYAAAAHGAPNLSERNHQMRQAARLNQVLRPDQ